MPDPYFEAAVNYDDALWRAAAESAIDTKYWDIFGQQHYASREALQIILRAIGWDTSSFERIENARRARFLHAAESLIDGTSVVGEASKWVALSVPADLSGTLRFEIQTENGEIVSGSADLSGLPRLGQRTLGDRHWSSYRLDLPSSVPLGYHTLTVTLYGLPPASSALIVCPGRMYLPENLAAGAGTAGFNVALYGLRSRHNWGCGDFTDLKVLLEWAAKRIGFSFVGLNPLHALHNRTPYNTSPYLPLSMYYKNLIYIDIEAVPEFGSSACARRLLASPQMQALVQKLRDAEFVEYSEVSRLKRRFLKLLYRNFRRLQDPARVAAFAAYRQREGDLLFKFALYSALDESLHKQNQDWWTWRDWPDVYHSPDSAESQSFAHSHARSVEFYQYVQFVLDEQLAAAQKYAKDLGMAIGLYHDLAVATDNFGSDLWAYPDHYVDGCRVGAPPDDFSPQGQDWGFPPPNKLTHRAEGYRLYRESIRKIVGHGGALRIDHVMRLYRLFWVPQGMSPAAGAYVRDFAEDLLHVLALESVRSGNIIIGEDLGTVTDEMRELFTRLGILSYRLFPFEKNYKTGEFKNSFEYPRQALVSSSTHDLPTMAGFWQGRDIEARLEAGLIDPAGSAGMWQERKREKQRMLDTLHSENLLPAGYTRDASSINDLDGDLHNAIVGFLSRVPSLMLLLNQEDLTKESRQQNLPGSTAQYPNWQRKMRFGVEDLSRPELVGYGQMFHDQLKRAGRA